MPRRASAGLSYLNAADAASWTTAAQADTLRTLGRAASMQTAARARVLSAFRAQGGYEDDGRSATRSWGKWQTRITGGAASRAIGWMGLLATHPAVADALAEPSTTTRSRRRALHMVCRNWLRLEIR